MSGMGAVLVHGYLGCPADLDPLAVLLGHLADMGSVETVSLYHPCDAYAGFDIDRFADAVAQALLRCAARGQEVLLVGHSTGGIAALAALERLNGRLSPALLVLAGTPGRIDGQYMLRWEAHVARAVNDGRFRWGKPPGLADIGRMVRAVNRLGAYAPSAPFPVLLVYGEEDRLVPPSERRWFDRPELGTPLWMLTLPGADHDLLSGTTGEIVADLVARRLDDLAVDENAADAAAIVALKEADPRITRFFTQSPLSARHIVQSPAGRRARTGRLVLPEPLPESVPWEPVIANVEITTRCALACVHCARTLLGRKEATLSPERFQTALGLLPHAYQVTFVGLGEPFLHPELHRIVAQAAQSGRKTCLVTSGAGLTAERARAVLEAGIDQVTFSLDAASPELAAELRPGLALETLLENFRTFVSEARKGAGARREKGPPDLAVFSALSTRSVFQTADLCRLAGKLGVQAIVFTDLNFAENQRHTLWRAATEGQKREIRRAVAGSFRAGLPVLGVRGIEEIGVSTRSRQVALLPVEQLWERSERHRFCVSPWQTIPVAADGTVTLCDCRPTEPIGNLFEDPLSEIWNGQKMRAFRREMTRGEPPKSCLACPRF